MELSLDPLYFIVTIDFYGWEFEGFEGLWLKKAGRWTNENFLGAPSKEAQPVMWEVGFFLVDDSSFFDRIVERFQTV